MSFFRDLFTSSSVLGVDIGTTSIKIVELHRGKRNPNIANYGLLETTHHFDRENDVIQANSLKISDRQVISLLRVLLKKSHFKSRNVIASIPSFASYTTLVEMPQMSDSETKKAMAFQIQKSIPLPTSQVAVDWTRVGSKEDENGVVRQFILIVAIPNDIIQKYKEIFKNVGLKLQALEVEHISYTRSIIGGDKNPTIILDIGARSTNITIVEGGFVKDNKQIDYAGDSLTEAISRGIGVSGMRAEELKKSRGLLDTGRDSELSALQSPFLDVIIDEVIKEKAKFEDRFDIKLQRVIIIGGGAELLGIEKYIENKIELPTVLGNGLLYVDYPPKLEVVSKEIKVRFATAIGLSIKQFM